MREHITLQFGNFSNYVGSHSWNSIDEQQTLRSRGQAFEGDGEDEDIPLKAMYRISQDARGRMVTYPRVMYIDASGNMSRYINADEDSVHTTAAADPQSVFASWRGEVNLIQQPSVTTNRFIRPESNVWSYDSNWGGGGHVDHEEDYEEEEEGEEEYEYDSWTGEEKLVRRRRPTERPFGIMGEEASGSIIEEGDNDDEAQQLDDELEPARDGEIKEWADFLKVPLHTQSLHELPMWHDGQDNTYFAGMSKEFISSSALEELYDSFRFFLEECDTLECVTSLVDGTTGAGGVAGRLIEEVRDEIGKCIMPVTLFTDPGEELARSDSSAKAIAVRECGVPLAYATFMESASMLIPIDTSKICELVYGCSDHTLFRSSAVAATALETAFSPSVIPSGTAMEMRDDEAASDRPRVKIFDSHSLCDAVTNRGAFRVLSLEAKLGIGAAGQIKPNTQNSHGNINPFLTSLSASTSGHFAHNNKRLNSSVRNFTNVLSARGVKASEWTDVIEKQQLASPFTLTTKAAFKSPIPMPATYPSFPNGQRAHTFTATAGLGCGPFMGDHVAQMRDVWVEATSTRARTVQSQLEGVSLERDLCSEVSETLMGISERLHGSF